MNKIDHKLWKGGKRAGSQAGKSHKVFSSNFGELGNGHEEDKKFEAKAYFW